MLEPNAASDEVVVELAGSLETLARELFGTACVFDFGGKQYIAIAQDCWVNHRAGPQGSRRLLGHVAGRITISGKRHIVLDCAPELDGAGAQSSIAQILTRRELQIALLVSEGGGDKDIARKLGISTYTVREHMRRIFNKLGVSKRSAVVARVLSTPYSGAPAMCNGPI